jgi:hypothetical protein
VFGLEAQTKGWLVLDGNVLYGDRHAHGNLMEEGSKVQGQNSKPKERIEADFW